MFETDVTELSESYTFRRVLTTYTVSRLTAQTWFASMAAHMGLVVHKVALEQAFLRVLWFSPVTVTPHSLMRRVGAGHLAL
jgi:hypothetical protein